MMYWIVFALYTFTETLTDLLISWFPLYYELKIAFVIWLLSPYTRGASLIYRKFLHPLLSSKEREIDDYIVQAKERGYETMVNFGKQGLNLAATAAVTAAVKNIGALSYGIPVKKDSEDDKTDEEREGTYSEDEMFAQRGLRRTQSMKSVKTIKGRKEASAMWLTKIQSEEKATSVLLIYTVQLKANIYVLIVFCFFGPISEKQLAFVWICTLNPELLFSHTRERKDHLDAYCASVS
ncbi:hypothetical protein Chor_013798 [Crotalus horridus]